VVYDPVNSELRQLIQQNRQVASHAARSKETLNTICTHLRPLLMSLCRGHFKAQLQPKAGESDLVQEALLGVSQGFHAFRGQTVEELYAWANGILYKKSVELQRHYLGIAKRDVTRERSLSTPSTNENAANLKTESTTPLDKMVGAEDAIRVRELVSRLEPHYGDVIRLRHLMGLSFAEIATRLGRTEPSIKNIYVRAVEQLERGMKRHADL
jgi:RNA polymerase sigma-70 factor (ECF subfamily)